MNAWETARNYQELVERTADHAWTSTRLFAPELILTLSVVLMLGLRVLRVERAPTAGRVALFGSAAAFLAACVDWNADAWGASGGLAVAESVRGVEFFHGMLVLDRLTLFWRLLLCGTLLLFTLLSLATGVPSDDDAPEIYTLVFSSTVGLCAMTSANHLAMVFLGMELATVPLYALAGLQKGRPRSSEAALKFAVFGAGASAAFLYGASLLAGVLGSAHLPTMAARLAELAGTPAGVERQGVLLLAGLLTFAGLAFKLSLVPLHFWTPDVFEGATAEVDAFLSVASKAAALGLLIRLALAFGGAEFVVEAPPAAPAGLAAAPVPPAIGFSGKDQVETAARPRSGDPAAVARLQPLRGWMVFVLSLAAAATVTFGNLAAFGQSQVKRLLAYSTIAHAGFLLMPVAAAVALLGRDPGAARSALAEAALYVVVYLFLNVGAFGVVAFLRNQMHSEKMDDYAGLIQAAPGVALCMSALLVGLVGLPPSAGFVAKFSIFAALVEANLWTLLLVAVANTVVSLFYYLRLVKVMTIDPPAADRLPLDLPLCFSPGGWFTLLATIPTIALFFLWDALARFSLRAVDHLFSAF